MEDAEVCFPSIASGSPQRIGFFLNEEKLPEIGLCFEGYLNPGNRWVKKIVGLPPHMRPIVRSGIPTQWFYARVAFSEKSFIGPIAFLYGLYYTMLQTIQNQ